MQSCSKGSKWKDFRVFLWSPGALSRVRPCRSATWRFQDQFVIDSQGFWLLCDFESDQVEKFKLRSHVFGRKVAQMVRACLFYQELTNWLIEGSANFLHERWLNDKRYFLPARSYFLRFFALHKAEERHFFNGQAVSIQCQIGTARGSL